MDQLAEQSLVISFIQKCEEATGNYSIIFLIKAIIYIKKKEAVKSHPEMPTVFTDILPKINRSFQANVGNFVG